MSEYLARARKKNEPIVITHHGKPYALIQPLSEQDSEELEWKELAKKRLGRAWQGNEGCPLRLPVRAIKSSSSISDASGKMWAARRAFAL